MSLPRLQSKKLYTDRSNARRAAIDNGLFLREIAIIQVGDRFGWVNKVAAEWLEMNQHLDKAFGRYGVVNSLQGYYCGSKD